MCKTNIKYNLIMCINVCKSIHLIFPVQSVCVCAYSIFPCIVRMVERRRMQYSIKIKELVRVHFLYKSINETKISKAIKMKKKKWKKLA